MCAFLWENEFENAVGGETYSDDGEMTAEFNRASSRLFSGTFDADRIESLVIECREDLGADPAVVFAFVSPDWKPHLSELGEILQIHGHSSLVIGSSTDGLVGVGEERENSSGLSLLLLHLPNTDLRAKVILEGEVQKMEEAKAGALSEQEGDEQEGAWIVLGDPAHLPAENWLRQWNSAWPNSPCYGGLASGNPQEAGFFLFRETGLVEDAAALLLHLVGGVRFESVVSQGCRPIGDPYTITEVNENVLVKVGQRQAYEILEQAYEALEESEQESARGNIFAGLAVNEYVDEFKRGDFLVRNIIGGDPSAGVLALGAWPRVGQTLQFQLRDREAADEDFRLQCEQAQQDGGQPFASLLFTCGGRGLHMFKTPHHDAGTLEEVFGKVPSSGYFCSGEIGPVGGTSFVHGYTAVALFLI
ncbi:MAG: FIST C-terminal domain-containing protein [Verrucomicrobiota bacterium]